MHKRSHSKLLLVTAMVICASIILVLARNSYSYKQDMGVEIWADSVSKMDEPLTLHWKLTNNSQVPICIYSSFLHEKNYVGIIIDPDTRATEIRFARLKPSTYVPAYFPSAEFMQIDPGDSIEGVFTSKSSIRDMRDVSNVSAPGGLTSEQADQLGTRIAAGVWSVQALFAYGFGDFESIEKEFESKKTGDEHPINQVVRWQKLVSSKPISIRCID